MAREVSPFGATRPRKARPFLATLILALLVLLGLIALRPAARPRRRPPPPRRAGSSSRKGEAGCIHRRGTNRCAQGRVVTSPEDIVVSPDGRHVYVASYGSHGDRDLQAQAAHRPPRAAAAAAAAASGTRVGEFCMAGRALGGPVSIAISPDGSEPLRRRPPAATRSASSRATGEPGCCGSSPAARGCFSQRPGGGCSSAAP